MFQRTYGVVAYLKVRYLRIEYNLRPQILGGPAIGFSAGPCVHVAVPGYVKRPNDCLLPDGRGQFLNQGAIGDLRLDAKRARMGKLDLEGRHALVTLGKVQAAGARQ